MLNSTAHLYTVVFILSVLFNPVFTISFHRCSDIMLKQCIEVKFYWMYSEMQHN